MRFHLIDRIDALEPGRAVRARKVTSRLEDHWRDTGRGPEMPAPLVLEALCQAGTWLIMITTDLRRRAALLSVDGVAFHGPVRPGDIIELVGTVESLGDETAVLSGTATVDGRLVMTADAVMCALLPADELEDLEATRLLERRLTRGLSDAAGAR
ncbi:3-hydroxylacyl-ACP dehydratase [Streptomyces kaniharaensis]|uniref:3-hydroxylacyl-ACP dehydratase n=1 Tax=Streptomyces kaniharaensis TaxID=212423 RepID=A0A6N7L175_9ACTN|nr:hotdog domain-containing protein [Streptomyces kaniharaensis]MQS15553.1 3-hydroxylacyl-ACP dehydratase [Streptomyces kaniharaensis]